MQFKRIFAAAAVAASLAFAAPASAQTAVQVEVARLTAALDRLSTSPNAGSTAFSDALLGLASSSLNANQIDKVITNRNFASALQANVATIQSLKSPAFARVLAALVGTKGFSSNPDYSGRNLVKTIFGNQVGRALLQRYDQVSPTRARSA